MSQSALFKPSEPRRVREDVEPASAATAAPTQKPRSRREHIQGWPVLEDADRVVVELGKTPAGTTTRNAWTRVPNTEWFELSATDEVR